MAVVIKGFMYEGLSTDAKPTVNVPTNARFLETDTGLEYYWNGASWLVWLGDENYAILLMRSNILYVPTNAGWTADHIVNGWGWLGPSAVVSYTGVGVNGRGLQHTSLSGFTQGAGWLDFFNWGKKTYLVFNVSRINSDAQVIARCQLKEANAEGALAAKGIGLRMDNYALVGESYGTALGTVALGVTLNSGEDKQVVIIHDPDTPQIMWYVDGVLEGTQSTAANIPSGLGGATGYLVASIINGAAGGVDGGLWVFHPKIWQDR